MPDDKEDMIEPGSDRVRNDMSQRIVVSPGILANEVGGEALILCPQSQTYHLLDEVATRMWTLLAGSGSIEAVHAQLAAEYDVDPDCLRADLLGFISDLLRHQLIEVRRA